YKSKNGRSLMPEPHKYIHLLWFSKRFLVVFLDSSVDSFWAGMGHAFVFAKSTTLFVVATDVEQVTC
ncbi:MAG: hypothetical protein PF495_01810, partial [Spirochaetales bacterium]|nr:hypothetical protein [Spirochaetales bacterium]